MTHLVIFKSHALVPGRFKFSPWRRVPVRGIASDADLVSSTACIGLERKEVANIIPASGAHERCEGCIMAPHAGERMKLVRNNTRSRYQQIFNCLALGVTFHTN